MSGLCLFFLFIILLNLSDLWAKQTADVRVNPLCCDVTACEGRGLFDWQAVKGKQSGNKNSKIKDAPCNNQNIKMLTKFCKHLNKKKN